METLSKTRDGNVTSSEIYCLTKMGKIEMTPSELSARPKSGVGSKTTTKEGGFGEKALTYIKQCNQERKLGRSLDTDSNARPLMWGKVGEIVVFSLLPMSYKHGFDLTVTHSEIDYWLGTPDTEKEDACCDIKCPYSLTSFMDFFEPYKEEDKIIYEGGTIEAIRKVHIDGEKYYWQIVSNAILTNKKFGELIIYCPTKSELLLFKEVVNRWVGDANDVSFIHFLPEEKLPHIPEESKVKSLNIIRFEIPQADKDFLTDRVLAAGKLLING